MIPQINWSNNFLNLKDSFEFISFINSLKFSTNDVLEDWVSNPYADIEKIRNTIALLLRLEILKEDKYGKIRLVQNSNYKNHKDLSEKLVNELFNKSDDMILEVIPFDKLEFDEKKQVYGFYRNSSPMEYSGGLNLLVSLGVLEQIDSHFIHISHKRLVKLLEDKVVSAIKTVGKITPEALKRLIDLKEVIGLDSERFAYEYELDRLKKLGISKNPLQVSLIDVTKGYDIASFESKSSKEFDRFIEVKTFSTDNFYISVNELTKAKELGDCYFIYLVTKKTDKLASIEVVKNPAKEFDKLDTWGLEPTEFIVKRLA